MSSRYVSYYGTDAPPVERLNLKAGPVRMVFEPAPGFLRYLKLGESEILRGIYVAVRDHNWGTVAPAIDRIELDQRDDGFDLTFEVSCVEGPIDFFWRGHITGDAQGTVSYEMDGEARSTFLRNRIGFCVLHAPSACTGDPCRVEKDDGSVEDGVFPKAISPHQPFMDMRAISHAVAPGVTARVAFEGDVFEMEDQRNWTDASYKTYCTPLRLPFPVEVKEGDQIRQAVTVSLEGDIAVGAEETSSDVVVLSMTEATPVVLPKIGLGMASHGEDLSSAERERLRLLNLSHLRVDLHLSVDGWREALSQVVEESNALGVKLEIALFVSDRAAAELEGLCEALSNLQPNAARWLVFHEGEKSTTAGWVKLARSALKPYDPGAPVGAGSNAYFTELNRERPPVAEIDCVSYSMNPQVHAFDNASLVETLEAQRWTVDSTRAFVGHLPIQVSPVTLQPLDPEHHPSTNREVPILVSPVTLRPRFNPNATGPEPKPAAGALPSQVDVRQMSLFGAVWTLGSLKYLSQAGVDSITYFETTGRRGVMETEQGAPLPDQFPSIPGSVFPLFHVLADFGGMNGGRILPSKSSDALRVDGMVLKRGAFVRVLLGNMTAERQRVRVRMPLLSGTLRTEVMDETFFEVATEHPERFRLRRSKEEGMGQIEAVDGVFEMTLNPYAAVCVKGVANG